MADVDKILKLVADGVLSPQEADEILGALDLERQVTAATVGSANTAAAEPAPATTGSRHLRIKVSENGKDVVNLRIPMNLAGWASSFLPGLSDENTQRIRTAVASGERGPLIDINDDGSRVLIVSE